MVGNFNLDQMLPKHVPKVYPLIQNFNLPQLSHFSSHIHGEILDLVFGNSNSDTDSNSNSSRPLPYSDHFALFFKI